jgi:hypothetical protein
MQSNGSLEAKANGEDAGSIQEMEKQLGTWNEWPPQADLAKLIEERFPFDRLKEMIDK